MKQTNAGVARETTLRRTRQPLPREAVLREQPVVGRLDALGLAQRASRPVPGALWYPRGSTPRALEGRGAALGCAAPTSSEAGAAAKASVSELGAAEATATNAD